MAKRKPAKRSVKDSKSTISTEETDNALATQAIAAAYSSVNRVMLKVCRLCETKDGPFLNIFGAENMTAKKIDDIMPFVVAENDDLPHKICFRCSAKVEEFHEFIQKCTKTQESLRNALGKKETVTTKVKTRTLWEEKLNESNMSNDDICNALIRKAMEGIKDIPILSLKSDIKLEDKKDVKTEKEAQSSDDERLTKEIDPKKSNRRLRHNATKEESPPVKQAKIVKDIDNKETKTSKRQGETKKFFSEKLQKEKPLETTSMKTNTFSIDDDSNDKKEDPKPAFNIMDHVSMIKVNGVGILFQCKLCNRNFLKKEVVMSHACAKNRSKKVSEEPKPLIPEPQRIPMIKFINTNVQSEKTKTILNNSPISIDDNDDDEEDDKPLVQKKPKPRIGPASKVKRVNKSPEPETSDHKLGQPQKQFTESSLVIPDPSSSLPAGPHIGNKYKLMPGPNNTFILVEDKQDIVEPEPIPPAPAMASNINIPKYVTNFLKQIKKPTPAPEETEVPYPVGLIKKVSHASPLTSLPDSFTTPAMKKQSYTVVQTGNPSKLLISTKPQPTEELSTRKSTKEESSQKPYSVTLEVDDRPKNASFFTFVNVDPLLQPSYVLPTDSNIQESQISTSTTAKSVSEDLTKYTCNMCGEKFSREKKLLSHIQCHYNQMDAEDKLRAQKNPRKKKSKT